MPLLDKIAWQIEHLLDDDVSLGLLAEKCAISSFHMSRVFRMATGMSPMAYVRARRLSKAATMIAAENSNILTVALNTGYGSHEAFTRAFVSYFGTSPSTVKMARSTLSLSLMEPLKMNNSMIVDVAKHTVQSRDAFRVVGASAACTFEYTSAIPALWRSFNAHAAETENTRIKATYGVCCDADETGRFRYLAGVEATEKAAGADFVDIPATRYAVFNHTGHISDLPKTVYTIWNKALPDAGITPATSQDFERYDRRFDPETGHGTVEIWVPIT